MTVLGIRGVLLDLGGVVYSGDRPLPGSLEAVERIKNAGLGLRYITNTTRTSYGGLMEKLAKIGVVAGCYITDGVIPRNAGVRLLRDNIVIFEGKISSLRRFKDDVSEVRNGFECGIGLEQYQDVKPGDNIEAFLREEVAPTL